MPNLKRLYLSSVSPSLIDLTKLRESCPFLMYLTLDGVSLKLEYPTKEEINSPLNDDLIFHHLIELRIISAHINCEPLDPLLIVYLLTKMTKGIKCLHLDHCENFKEENFLSLFQEHSLTQIEDIRLSRASGLSDKVIHLLTRECPRLKRLVLTMLPRERKGELELLKAYLKDNNVNLEIITFTNKSFILG
ncbi:hypothetical protein Avbf_10784 [Armadillidium vulgare]|nr:hypothetical protein Avbf_10784 [Armadillidium vulgare]